MTVGARSSARRPPVGGLVKVAVLVVSIAIAWRAGDVLVDIMDPARSPGGLPREAIAAAMVAYVALTVLPFCPGIEVGLALIVLVGPDIVPLIYLATVAALMLAFSIGRFVPAHTVIEVLGLLRLSRARELLLRIEPLETEQRLHLLLNARRPRLVRWLLEHRYVAVGIALNTPGNLVLGDGGGIALAAGFSRLFSLRLFALTVALAVSPIPLAMLLLQP